MMARTVIAVSKMHHEDGIKNKPHRSCTACNNKSRGHALSSAVYYPNQGAGPRTACRFTFKHTRELLVDVGPTSYKPERVLSAFAGTLNKATSTRGYSLGARLAPRFYQHSSVSLRQLDTRPSPSAHPQCNDRISVRVNKKPFNSSAPRPPLFSTVAGPGPGAYEVNAPRDRRIQFLEHFGSGRSLVTAVHTRCQPSSELQCFSCGQPPVGDFWSARDPNIVWCRECTREIQAVLPQGARRAASALQPLRKERDCREIHCHEGTTAAVRLRPERKQGQTQVREAYLSLYFP